MAHAARDMALPEALLRHLRRGSALCPTPTQQPWALSELRGRLVELADTASGAALTAAFGLVREAQGLGETAAWVTSDEALFFPPDAAEGGVELSCLPVVRVPRSLVLRAVDRLARSNAFGLIIVDLLPGAPAARPDDTRLPSALATRLLGAAHRHGAAVVLLVRGPSPVGSLVSLRVEAHRRRIGPAEFQLEVRAVKDKRRPPGWRAVELCRGPAGLR